MGAVMITTYFTGSLQDDPSVRWPFLLLLTVVYGVFFRKPKPSSLSEQRLEQRPGITGQASE